MLYQKSVFDPSLPSWSELQKQSKQQQEEKTKFNLFGNPSLPSWTEEQKKKKKRVFLKPVQDIRNVRRDRLKPSKVDVVKEGAGRGKGGSWTW